MKELVYMLEILNQYKKGKVNAEKALTIIENKIKDLLGF